MTKEQTDALKALDTAVLELVVAAAEYRKNYGAFPEIERSTRVGGVDIAVNLKERAIPGIDARHAALVGSNAHAKKD